MAATAGTRVFADADYDNFRTLTRERLLEIRPLVDDTLLEAVAGHPGILIQGRPELPLRAFHWTNTPLFLDGPTAARVLKLVFAFDSCTPCIRSPIEVGDKMGVVADYAFAAEKLLFGRMRDAGVLPVELASVA